MIRLVSKTNQWYFWLNDFIWVFISHLHIPPILVNNTWFLDKAVLNWILLMDVGYKLSQSRSENLKPWNPNFSVWWYFYKKMGVIWSDFWMFFFPVFGWFSFVFSGVRKQEHLTTGQVLIIWIPDKSDIQIPLYLVMFAFAFLVCFLKIFF